MRDILDEPLHPAFESGKPIDDIGLERLNSKQRNQTDGRTRFERSMRAIGQAKRIVEKSVFGVPQGKTQTADVHHRMRNMNEVLEEFAGKILVVRILPSEFESDLEHVEAIHAH